MALLTFLLFFSAGLTALAALFVPSFYARRGAAPAPLWGGVWLALFLTLFTAAVMCLLYGVLNVPIS